MQNPSSSSAGKDPGQYVSIDDLVSEIEQCTPPDKMDLMRTLLQDLRQKNLTLKEFCKRVRMTMGEEVLRQTVGGLRRARAQHPQRRYVPQQAHRVRSRKWRYPPCR